MGAGISLPPVPNAYPESRGLVIRFPIRKDTVEGTGRPKFLEDPVVPMPCSPTPAGPDIPRPDGVPVLPPRRQRRELQRVVLSGLNRTA
jgi:hypothetical protein